MWFNDDSIAMLDWQFVNAGIGTWDATYYMAMAHDANIRRENEDKLIDHYYLNLSSSYKDMHSEDFSYTKEQCMEDYHLLKAYMGGLRWFHICLIKMAILLMTYALKASLLEP